MSTKSTETLEKLAKTLSDDRIPKADESAKERTINTALTVFDKEDERKFQGNSEPDRPIGNSNRGRNHTETKSEESTMTIAVEWNQSVNILDPEILQAVTSCLDKETAYPPVKHLVEKYDPSYGSCVIATVVCLALMKLEGKDTTLKPFVVRDMNEEGTPIEEHLVLSNGTQMADLTRSPGKFDIYPDEQAKEALESMLTEESLESRIQLILDRMSVKNFTAEQIIEAFREVVQEGYELDIPTKKLRQILGIQ